MTASPTNFRWMKVSFHSLGKYIAQIRVVTRPLTINMTLRNALYKITLPLDPPDEVLDVAYPAAEQPAALSSPVAPAQPLKVKKVYHLHQHHHHHGLDTNAPKSAAGPQHDGSQHDAAASREMENLVEQVGNRQASTKSTSTQVTEDQSNKDREDDAHPPPQNFPFGLGSDDNWEAMNVSHSELHRINELLKMGEERSVRGLEVDEEEDDAKESGSGNSCNQVEHPDIQKQQDDLQRLPHEPVRYVVLLLHESQPLSYLANLIRAEHPSAIPGVHQRLVEEQAEEHHQRHRSPETEEQRKCTEERRRNDAMRTWASLEGPPVSFLTRASAGRRWSPATSVGEFLRDAARVGSFIIRIGDRAVQVKVPSFEDRTRRLRAELYAKTGQIQTMVSLKAKCDAMAYRDVRRLSWTGMAVLASWWVSVTYLTFWTELGWDTMEPATYLIGLLSLMCGYGWVLHNNREVSYRAVLNETTSRRQQRLYNHHGLDIDQYQELIQQAKGLRHAIKLIASEYDLSWNQSETRAGQTTVEALKIIRQMEMRDRAVAARHEEAAAAASTFVSGSDDGDDAKLHKKNEGIRDEGDDTDHGSGSGSSSESGAKPK